MKPSIETAVTSSEISLDSRKLLIRSSAPFRPAAKPRGCAAVVDWLSCTRKGHHPLRSWWQHNMANEQKTHSVHQQWKCTQFIRTEGEGWDLHSIGCAHKTVNHFYHQGYEGKQAVKWLEHWHPNPEACCLRTHVAQQTSAIPCSCQDGKWVSHLIKGLRHYPLPTLTKKAGPEKSAGQVVAYDSETYVSWGWIETPI